MITHLISTTEFVKLINNKYKSGRLQDHIIAYHIIERYANFISQKPTLGMFVPVDEEGNILDEPVFTEEDKDYPHEVEWYKEYYKQAQSKVLFKGWEYKNNTLWYNNKHVIPMYDFEDYYTLERLQYGKGILELTEEALKQIGL